MNETAMERAGSSPRVRSRPVGCRHGERTRWDHLRVCGADLSCLVGDEVGDGSSPRVRSRHFPSRVARPAWGIISACAEQTNAS